jgi:hypothetical protein
METTARQNHSVNSSGIITIRISMLMVIAALTLSVSSCVTTAALEGPGTGATVVPPSWAPAYEHIGQVRYYYLPDIEVYYDVFNHEFVYMDNGSWMFSPTLPPMYSWYNLSLGFTVVLDYRVHQPWMHFHSYVSNYPRYYYQTVYRDTYIQAGQSLRGFNENTRSVVYHNSAANSATRVNEAGSPTRMNNAGNTKRSATNSSANGSGISRNNSTRQLTNSGTAVHNKNAGLSRAPQRMNYYGKHIGRPVKVTRKMSVGHVAKKGKR